MLSLFKNWKKSSADSKCSSQPAPLPGAEENIVSPENNMNEEKENTTLENEEEIILTPELNLRDKIELALHTVYDPEIPVNIMELGLVYSIEIKDDNVIFVTMTLTAPACPVAGDIVLEVESKIRSIEDVKDVHVQLTFDPPWNKEMMSEEAKLELGFL